MPIKGERIENFAAIMLRQVSSFMQVIKIMIRLEVPEDDQQAERLYRRYLDFKFLIESHT